MPYERQLSEHFKRPLQLSPKAPVSIKNRPKAKKDEIEETVNVYSEEEVLKLFEAVKNQPFHWQVFTTLAAGLRHGELLGLEWKNVDLEEGTIYVKQVISRRMDGAKIKRPKSKTSRRIISLPESVVEELKVYKKHWDQEKEKMKDGWIEADHEWLFCNVDGTHFYPTTPTTW